MKNITGMSLDELYSVKGRIITDLDILQNDLKVVHQRIMELRQENKPKILDNKTKQ